MKADKLLYSDCIFDGKKLLPYEGYIAIKDNKIIGVGDYENRKQHTGSGVKEYDLRGSLIMPGFHDNHNHIYLSMIFNNAVFLGGTKSEEEAAELLSRNSVSEKDEEWILGYGWHHAKWYNQKTPDKKSLDKYFPNTPVFLMHETGHAAWINSVALKKFHIGKDTKNPVNGIIDRDINGEPTGFLLEDAYLPVAKEAFQLAGSKEAIALESYLKKTAANGITSVDDMFYIMGLDLGKPELYRRFEDEDRLSVRIHFYKQITKDIQLLKPFEQFKTNKVKFMGVKMFLDGVASTFTAKMVEPYYTRRDFYGESFYTQQQLNELMDIMDQVNYKMRIHAVGDGSVRMALDACEYVEKKNGKKDRRHCVEHIEIIHPDDINRFAELKMIPSIQPNHMAITHHLKDNPFLSVLGVEREPYYWIGKTLIDSCPTVTYGTDFPISDQNALKTVFRAVNRVMDDMEPIGGWNPQEKVCLETALRCYTYNGAYSNFQEDSLGSLEEGKFADITVINKNLFQSDPMDILNAEVIMTVSDGSIVFEK